METTIERLYELRGAVESANEAWFDALKAGANGDGQRQVYKDLLVQYRAYESKAIAEGLRETCWKCGGNKVVGYGRVFLTKTYVSRSSGAVVGSQSDRWCFSCGGVGTQAVHKHRFDAQASTRLKRWLEAEAKNEAAAKEAEAKWEEFQNANFEMATFMRERAGEDDFVADMVASVERWGQLTEKQIAVVVQKMEHERQERERVEKLKSGGPYPSGKQTVEGEVVSYKSQRGYGGGTVFKMLVVLSTGHKAWGTVPEALFRAANEMSTPDTQYQPDDLRITFTATFSRSDDDPAFGFFKSPKGVKVLGLREGVAA